VKIIKHDLYKSLIAGASPDLASEDCISLDLHPLDPAAGNHRGEPGGCVISLEESPLAHDLFRHHDGVILISYST